MATILQQFVTFNYRLWLTLDLNDCLLLQAVAGVLFSVARVQKDLALSVGTSRAHLLFLHFLYRLKGPNINILISGRC